MKCVAQVLINGTMTTFSYEAPKITTQMEEYSTNIKLIDSDGSILRWITFRRAECVDVTK